MCAEAKRTLEVEAGKTKKIWRSSQLTDLNVAQVSAAMSDAELSEQKHKEIERLKNVAIKPRWGSDETARATAVDVIASYGVRVIPILIEITQRADSRITQHRANEWILRLRG